MAVSLRLGLAAALAGLGGLGVAVYIAGRTSAPGPPGSPGCVPVSLIASGPGSVSGCGGQARNSTAQLCPQPGEQCVYTAWPDPGAQFQGWSGPGGVTSSSNPITLPISSPGFVSGAFSGGSPGSPGALPPCPRGHGFVVSNGQPGSKVYVIDANGAKDWIPSGFVQAVCLIPPGIVTTCDVDAVPNGPNVSWPGCAGVL